MNTRLRKGLYDALKFWSGEEGLFGLCSCQTRIYSYFSKKSLKMDRCIKNAGWYNRDGERIGWGDLSLEDMVRIRDGLEEGELFLILSEGDAFFNLERMKRLGKSIAVVEDINFPGIAYVWEKLAWFVSSKGIYRIDKFSNDDKLEEIIPVEDEIYTKISHKKATQLLLEIN